MSSRTPRDPDDGNDRLIADARRRVESFCRGAGSRWLLVDVASQRLLLLENLRTLATWPVSTAAAGLGSREGSRATPPGVHRIGRKIGHDAPTGTVFASRRPTGDVWPDTMDVRQASSSDLILTRILTLEGCEPGLNRGPGVDSSERYIYLHGTNHEDNLGRPCSHGCVRLSNADVRRLFDRVKEGDPLVIV